MVMRNNKFYGTEAATDKNGMWTLLSLSCAAQVHATDGPAERNNS